jgi:hypothetical protein
VANRRTKAVFFMPVKRLWQKYVVKGNPKFKIPRMGLKFDV